MTDSIPSEVWWKPDFSNKLTPEVRNWFRRYSGIDDDHLQEHLLHIRAEGWKYHKYPCVGSWIFILPILPRFTTYGGAVQRAIDPSSEFSTENPFTVLDLGCCFGQDLRRLVTDGLDPTENGRIRFVAADLHSELWELGFALFKDQSRLQATFQQLDWLDPDASARMFFERELKAKTDLIFACQFLHLFGWERQKIAVRRLIQCSRVGTVVMGYQIGSVDPRELSRPWGNMYFHDVHTFQELWSEVAGEMSTSWILDVELVPLSNWGLDLEDWLWMGQDRRGLNFTCRRIGKGCDSMSLTNI